MKHNSSSNLGGFTLLVILGVIGFLLILLTGIFKVVLLELKDTKDMDYYLKSRSASEAGEEIALLQIKEKGFGFDGKVEYKPNGPEGQSIMLSANPGNKDDFLETKDVFFGYDIDSKTDSYDGILYGSGSFQVIPLFYTEDSTRGDTKKPNVVITSGNAADFIWNIIGENGGISGKGAFNASTSAQVKTINSNAYAGGQAFDLTDIDVGTFLESSTENYLTILNPGVQDIEYKIETDDGESFTKPITTIYSSAKIGEIKQNIKLEIDNSQYFDVLKYSIYDSQ